MTFIDRGGRPARNGGASLRSGADLGAAGLIRPGEVTVADRVAERYPVALTPHLAQLIRPADPKDPIARQFLPSVAELEPAAGELADPIGDAAHSPVKGVVHRHPDRVLLQPILACPVYCRFCFRRERVGPDGGALTPAETNAALAYIEAHHGIWEVILTGGDPLMLSDRRLGELVARVAAIDHVQTIRVHTRVPIADPARITDALCNALDSSKPVWVAIHCNHPRELDAEAIAACRRLVRHGIPLVSQTVLLKGVNDDVDTLEALMRALVAARIKPYYLHHPDLAPGTGHFRLTVEEGRSLVAELRRRASGLAQPAYVLDIPGGFGKSPVGPAYLEGEAVRDLDGRTHRYPPKI
jgi:lysine 2,3-aminomutase